MFHTQNRQRLLEFFEAGAPEFTFDIHTGFSSKSYGRDEIPRACGSAGCIAGAAYLMALGDMPEHEARKRCETALFVGWDDGGGHVDWREIARVSTTWLGIENDPDKDFNNDLFDPNLAPKGCTADDAAEAIRRVIRGEKPWPN